MVQICPLPGPALPSPPLAFWGRLPGQACLVGLTTKRPATGLLGDRRAISGPGIASRVPKLQLPSFANLLFYASCQRPIRISARSDRGQLPTFSIRMHMVDPVHPVHPDAPSVALYNGFTGCVRSEGGGRGGRGQKRAGKRQRPHGGPMQPVRLLLPQEPELRRWDARAP